MSPWCSWTFQHLSLFVGKCQASEEATYVLFRNIHLPASSYFSRPVTMIKIWVETGVTALGCNECTCFYGIGTTWNFLVYLNMYKFTCVPCWSSIIMVKFLVPYCLTLLSYLITSFCFRWEEAIVWGRFFISIRYL